MTNSLTPSLDGDDEQDDEQDDEDGRRRDDDGGAAGQILVDRARLARGLAKLRPLERRDRGVGTFDRQARPGGDVLHGRVLQERPKRFTIRLFLADALLDRLVERGLIDDMGLLRPPRGWCAQHHRERRGQDSPKHLHELPPPIVHRITFDSGLDEASSVPRAL
jgi:hypothetical protein